ncbi:XRE family transcriptional regulator [Variovorax humicola]|uniref:XRE family transcriptional regulator n=1 Tax=Variovorax humicola TaxID=1769758 RepID=A0ABU8VUQ7_9BURK
MTVSSDDHAKPMRITPPVTDYRAPTPKDLQDLKEQFGLTAYEMARLFAVQPEQWRKHTGGQAPREISVTRAFFMAAFQVLSDDEIERVVAYMASFGARWNMDAEPPPRPEPRYRQRNEAS